MGDEESWNPPWDCDVDEDEEVDLSSPFRDSAPDSFRFAPIKGHPDFKTAKKHLNFDEVETKVEAIHRETNDETIREAIHSSNTKLQMEEPHKRKKKKKKNKKKKQKPSAVTLQQQPSNVKGNAKGQNAQETLTNGKDSPDIFASQYSENEEERNKKKEKDKSPARSSPEIDSDESPVPTTCSLTTSNTVSTNFVGVQQSQILTSSSSKSVKTKLENSMSVLSDQSTPNNLSKKQYRKAQNDKSTPKINKQADKDKENMTISNEKHRAMLNKSVSKDTIDWEGEGSCRISHILPDINWYPEQSKHVKDNIRTDFVIQFPLSFKAMGFMLQDDFELPKLNTVQRRSLFKYPSVEEKESIVKHCPNFKSGRFNEEERIEIIKGLKIFFNDLEFSEDEQGDFIKEMESFPSCHGGARGATSNNLIYIRLYFACHVAGRNILNYRLAYDIYNTILSVWYSEFDPMIKPNNIKKENMETEDNDNGSTDEGVRGRFQTKDSCELVRFVFSQLHSKALPIEIDEINLKDIDWKEIQKHTFRNARSMQKHFTLVILPLLKNGPNIELEDKTWQTDLIKILMEKAVVYIQDIDWKDIQKCHFPNNTTIQLRTYISNILKNRLQHTDQGVKKQPIHEMLSSISDRILNFNKSINKESSFVMKQNEITSFYEDLIHSLTNPFNERTSTPKMAVGRNNVNGNTNPNEKRKANDNSGGKNREKRRKTKHALFTEKSGTPNETFG